MTHHKMHGRVYRNWVRNYMQLWFDDIMVDGSW